MFRIFSAAFNPQPNRIWEPLIMMGVLITLSGLLVIFVPQILVAFAAFILLAVGLSVLFFGWKIKRLARKSQQIEINYIDQRERYF